MVLLYKINIFVKECRTAQTFCLHYSLVTNIVCKLLLASRYSNSIYSVILCQNKGKKILQPFYFFIKLYQFIYIFAKSNFLFTWLTHQYFALPQSFGLTLLNEIN